MAGRLRCFVVVLLAIVVVGCSDDETPASPTLVPLTYALLSPSDIPRGWSATDAHLLPPNPTEPCMAGSLLEYGGFVSKDGTQQLLQNISVFSDAPCVMEQIGNSAAQKIASGRFTGSVSADGQVVEFTDAASGSDGRHRTTLALPRGPFIALFEYQVADGVSPDLTADEIRDAASRKLEQVWQDCQRQSGESVCG